VHQEADMRAQEIISRMQARGLSTPLILLHETTLHASAHLSSFIFLSLYTLTHSHHIRITEPSASHYTALLTAATSPTRITAALQAMTDAGTRTSPSAVSCLCRACRVPHARVNANAWSSPPAGVEPTPVTYIAYFKACSRFAKVHGHGPTLHGYHQFKQRFGTVRLSVPLGALARHHWLNLRPLLCSSSLFFVVVVVLLLLAPLLVQSTLEKSTAMYLFGAVVTSLVQFISPTTEQEYVRAALTPPSQFRMRFVVSRVACVHVSPPPNPPPLSPQGNERAPRHGKDGPEAELALYELTHLHVSPQRSAREGEPPPPLLLSIPSTVARVRMSCCAWCVVSCRAACF
jgi:hypothetical protein